MSNLLFFLDSESPLVEDVLTDLAAVAELAVAVPLVVMPPRHN